MGDALLAVVPPEPASLPTNLEQLSPTIPIHFLALRLLGLATELSWPTRGGHPYRPTPDDQATAVAIALNMITPMLYVETSQALYRQSSPYLYERVEGAELEVQVMGLWNQHIDFMGGLGPKKIKDCIEMTKKYAHEREKTMSKRYISITPTLFWDSEQAALTDSPRAPVFFKLFDTRSPNQHYIQIPPLTDAQVDTLRQEYAKNLAYLTSHNGDLPEEYEFVTLWANYDHDVYMDIMRLMATPFMRKKPFGAYMLVGLKRNGKTALSNDFMKTMLGTNNCSAVQLANLGDWHENAALNWTLWNAPDEEDERPTQYATIFKTIADHGEVPLKQMYQREPLMVNADFMCAFPMNHHPVWTGSGAAACVERSRVIEFTHRFDQDNAPTSFSERTFTADLFCHILGPILALATYYKDRPFEWSSTMKVQQHALEGEMDSHTTYFDHFIAFFDGFTSVKVLYEDYQLWCAAHDVPVSTFSAFKLAFGPFTARKRTNLKVDNKTAKGYRVRQQGKRPLVNWHQYSILPQRGRVGPLSKYHDQNAPLRYSIVERCEALLEDEFGDDYERQLNKLILSATKAMASRPLEETPLPPEPAQLPLEDKLRKEK